MKCLLFVNLLFGSFMIQALTAEEVRVILLDKKYSDNKRGHLLFAQKYMPGKSMREVYEQTASLLGQDPSSLFKWDKSVLERDYSQRDYKYDQIIIEVSSIMGRAEKYPDNEDYRNHLAQIKGEEGLKKLAQSWSNNPEEEPSLDELMFIYNAALSALDGNSFRELGWPDPDPTSSESPPGRVQETAYDESRSSHCEYVGSTPSPIVFTNRTNLCSLPAICIAEVRCSRGALSDQSVQVYCNPIERQNRCPNADVCLNDRHVPVSAGPQNSGFQTLPWRDGNDGIPRRPQINFLKSSKGVR